MKPRSGMTNGQERMANHLTGLSNTLLALSRDVAILAKELELSPPKSELSPPARPSGIAAANVGDTLAEKVRLIIDQCQAEYLSSFDVLRAIDPDPAFCTKDNQTRVGMIVRQLGWIKIERRNKTPRYVYKRPKSNSD